MIIIKRHKTKIIAAVVIIAVLTAAWFYGGDYPAYTPTPSPSEDNLLQQSKTPSAPTPTESNININIDTDEAGTTDISDISELTEQPEIPAAITTPAASVTTDTITSVPEVIEVTKVTEAITRTPAAAITTEVPSPAPLPITERPTAAPTERLPARPPPATPSPTEPPTQVPTAEIPKPAEPQDNTTAGDGTFTVTLTVRCDTILNNINRLDKEKHELVPADGVIFPVTTVTVNEGESAFNVLQREMRRARIHMAFRNTPIYNSAYIEAINNIYEFDAGELSGWTYSVNGLYPGYGCSRYQLKPGDAVKFVYTCDSGRDVGAGEEAFFNQQN